MMKVREMCKTLFTGELTLKKRELWLVGGLCLMAGIVYGLRKAPWTHGVNIGCHNGCYNGSNQDCCEDFCGEEEQEEECCCCE